MNPDPRMCLAVSLLIACAPVRADWLPQWIGAWQHPETFHGVLPLGVHVLADGSVLAYADVTHHNSAHATLVRFEADGTFSWIRERTAVDVAGVAVLADGRVAMSGYDTAVFARVLDATSGELIHECTWSGAQLLYDERDLTRTLAQAADDGLLVRAFDGGDLVVLRCDAQGQVLPEWRWTSGLDFIRVDDIIALPDGGAVATVRGGTGDGSFTLKFDAAGVPTLLDSEPGEIGNALGALHVALDADGDFLLAAAPESSFGVPQAQAWKVAPDGTRLWTRVVEVPGVLHPNLDIGGFALAPDGDLVIAVAPPSGPFRVLRLDGGDGSTRWDATATIGDNPTGLALAADGRVLVGGFASIPGSGGRITARIAEFDADGMPCRHAIDLGINTKLRVAASVGGWTVFGATTFVEGSGNDAVVHRYDGDGTCDGDDDTLFVDGFDGAG
jgi:hypothetical protein